VSLAKIGAVRATSQLSFPICTFHIYYPSWVKFSKYFAGVVWLWFLHCPKVIVSGDMIGMVISVMYHFNTTIMEFL